MQSNIGTIHSPALPNVIPKHSKWLLGQGVGTWFCIDKTDNEKQYNIKRFTPKGSLDCDRIFEIENNGSVFDIKEPYQFTHISHCSKCRIVQNETVFVFNYIKE
ncbi:MAG: hypothetical protein COA97_06010 [Flavobacteriales bacterium]|nr:MAG: hypothetical protein COA97_06010 [Flavobacteriales bacterium]